MFYSASIDGVHMWDTYRMPLRRLDCVPPPKIKTNTIEIPGRDGVLDLTDYFGRVFYENRPIQMEFGRIYDRMLWPQIYSEILNRFHGKRCKVIFDDDPAYFWVGRVSIDDYERTLRLGQLKVNVDAEPYKYDLVSSNEDWLWDSFDFNNGVIREYKNLLVDGTLTVVVEGSQMPAVPEILSSTPMTVRFNNKTYDIKAGTNRIYDIEITEGEHSLIFTGKGLVSINYRGGSL